MSKFAMSILVPRVEVVWVGVRKIGFPHGRRPDGHVVLSTVVTIAGLTVVISKHEKKRCRVTESAEVKTLRQVLFVGLAVVSVFVDHKGVAQFDMKIRPIRERIGEGLFVFFRDNPEV